MTRRLVTALGVAGILILSVVATTPAPAGAATGPVVTSSVSVTPPDAGATEFGAALAFDGGRLVASARLGGQPVVYVFIRSGSTWAYAQTIAKPAGATSGWGRYLAVAGTTVAVSDPTYHVDLPNSPQVNDFRDGRVHLYVLHSSGVWKERQTLLARRRFDAYAFQVWLSGDGLVVRHGAYCDAFCDSGQWDLYRRGGDGQFALSYQSANNNLSGFVRVGVDAGRFALGNPGYLGFPEDPEEPPFVQQNNVLSEWDTNPSTPVRTQFETTPAQISADPPEYRVGWYRNVDISGPTLAYENCCSPENEVRIVTRTGEAPVVSTFPVDGPYDWLAVVPGVVLLADHRTGAWRTFVQRNGTWAPGTDVPAPDGAAGAFVTEPVAAGDQIAVRGQGVVWILTAKPSAPK